MRVHLSVWTATVPNRDGRPRGVKQVINMGEARGIADLQSLPNVDAVTVGVGEHKATQAVVGVAELLDDADAVRDQVVVKLGRIRHQHVCRFLDE